MAFPLSRIDRFLGKNAPSNAFWRARPSAPPLQFLLFARKGATVKRSPDWTAALLFALLAVPAVAQVNDTYVIPAAINSSGAYGSRWITQLSIFNPQSYALKVSVSFIPQGGGHPLESLVTVPSNAVAYADNSLLELFNVSGAGGAYVVATFPEDNPGVKDDMVSRSFLVNSNTVNLQPNGGTYGQTIPGTFTGLQDYTNEPVSAIAHGIRHLDQFGWRTNFGAVNLGSSPATLRVSVYDADGRSLIANASYPLPAQSQMQWRLPVQVDHGTIEFFVDDPTNNAVVFAYTSTLDRYTGDPQYQSPALLASAKYLYGKTAMAQLAVGKRIGIEDARAIRANAIPLGEVPLRTK
jgi:hypothetical protein